jgi:AraC family transcriptional activator of tynA and feaB
MEMLPSMSLLPTVDPSEWSEQIRLRFFPLGLEAHERAQFRARAIVKSRPACRLAFVRGSAHTATMARSDCTRLGRRYVKLLWQIDGSAQLEQGARSVRIDAGQWTVYEAVRPYEIHLSEGAAFAVMLCESSAAANWHSLSARIAHAGLPTTGPARMALELVRAALADDAELDAGTSSVLAESVRRFLGVAAHAHHEAGAHDGSSRRMVDDAIDFIETHLCDPRLGPDLIAAGLKVSRRTLYNAFHCAGQTPQAMLMHMRLQRCRAMLADPALSHRNVTQLAMEAGFNDAAYFSRLFRQHFGETPSTARARLTRR